ncbi:MAG: response regulator [Desulfovibrio sp.]|nr:response regulator [Desulfovibrio sp.]MBI4958123.1 response regulator [Desulfovibrio sp.]
MLDPTPPARSILTIDDDYSVRATIAAWIEDSGYTAFQASSGLEGIEQLTMHRPDLILLDLRMPVMDGLAFLEEMKALGNDTPVIIVSGRADLQDAIRAFRLGAWDYITKPIESFDLLDHAVTATLERRELARQVRIAEARYTNLVQNIPLVIFSLDASLELQFVNRACQNLLGFTQEEALAEPSWLLERVHLDDRERVRLAFMQNLADKDSAFSKTCRLIHKTGRTVHGIIKSIPQTTCPSGAALSGVEGVILDITDRLMLEKFLVQKEKVKTLGAISAEVAHEIRNPLVAIGGFARSLLKKEPGQPEAEIIFGEAQRLEKILDRIRDYLSPVRMHRASIQLTTVVRDCLELLAPEIEANNVLLELDMELPNSQVEEDPDLLTQIVINLIRATLASLPPKGTMWIRMFSSERFLHIEVGGAQVKPVEDVEKVFLPFDEGGESIGLPFCYRLLRTMGGSLVFDQKDGKGIFTMSVLHADQAFSRNNPED